MNVDFNLKSAQPLVDISELVVGQMGLVVQSSEPYYVGSVVIKVYAQYGERTTIDTGWVFVSPKGSTVSISDNNFINTYKVRLLNSEESVTIKP